MEELPPGVYWDDQLMAMVIKRSGPWFVAVSKMLFNDRVTLTHERQYPLFVNAGYCYDKGLGAFAAAAAWDPLTEPRPVGYKKIAYEDSEMWEILNTEWNEKQVS